MVGVQESKQEVTKLIPRVKNKRQKNLMMSPVPLKTHILLRNILMALLVKYADNRSYVCGDIWLSNR